MELLGVIGGNEHQIKIEQKGDRVFSIQVDDREYEVDCIELMPNLYSILHGDRSYEVRVHPNGKGDRYDTHFFKDTFQVEMTDPMKKLLEGGAGGGQKGEAVMEAPMPGQVQRILVKEGDEVTEDQGLVVLVAMKMENELGSPKAGVVKKIMVSEGDNVEGSAPLVIIA